MPNEGECDSEEENDIRDKIDEVQQTVEDFHDILMPEALEYYLNLNEDFDMLDAGSEDDSDGEGSGSGDSDEDGDKKKKKKDKKAGGAGGEGGAEGQQECKQQ